MNEANGPVERLARQADGNPAILLLQPKAIELISQASEAFERSGRAAGRAEAMVLGLKAVTMALACAKWEAPAQAASLCLTPRQVAETLLTVADALSIRHGLVREDIERHFRVHRSPPEGTPQFSMPITLFRDISAN